MIQRQSFADVSSWPVALIFMFILTSSFHSGELNVTGEWKICFCVAHCTNRTVLSSKCTTSLLVPLFVFVIEIPNVTGNNNLLLFYTFDMSWQESTRVINGINYGCVPFPWCMFPGIGIVHAVSPGHFIMTRPLLMLLITPVFFPHMPNQNVCSERGYAMYRLWVDCHFKVQLMNPSFCLWVTFI